MLRDLVNSDKEKSNNLVALIRNRLNKLIGKIVNVSIDEDEDEAKNKRLDNIVSIVEEILKLNEKNKKG